MFKFKVNDKEITVFDVFVDQIFRQNHGQYSATVHYNTDKPLDEYEQEKVCEYLEALTKGE